MSGLNRRHVLKLASAGAASSAFAVNAQAEAAGAIPKWEIFELTLSGPKEGNPFREVQLSATFINGARRVTADGFYDGDGVYKIRFMPDAEGEWSYQTSSNKVELSGKQGSFRCAPQKAGVHGPVTANGHHFVYADGAPFLPFGTTSYAWIHQSESLQKTTLKTLAKSAFNKIRMCVFPKHYEYNHNEPALYPFERNAAGVSDFTRPNPAFYRHLETQITALRDLGIEADLILFHPYDRWGYASMAAEDDDHYLRYVVARLASHRNIWWSMANEYDFMKAKSVTDFDRLFRILVQADPSSHLRGIHQGKVLYDHSHAWITHACVQGSFFEKTSEYLQTWRKPVLFDEVEYEGNLNRRWGNLSGQELTYRFWRGLIAGAYVSHGETLLSEHDSFDEDATPQLWWAHGGSLIGTSPQRIAFLRKVLEEIIQIGKQSGLEPVPNGYYTSANVLDGSGNAVAALYFFDYHQPIWNEFTLPKGQFSAELIDPWAMTRHAVGGSFSGKAKLKLPAKPYQALLFRKVG
jgi:hypothetical protein